MSEFPTYIEQLVSVLCLFAQQKKINYFLNKISLCLGVEKIRYFTRWSIFDLNLVNIIWWWCGEWWTTSSTTILTGFVRIRSIQEDTFSKKNVCSLIIWEGPNWKVTNSILLPSMADLSLSHLFLDLALNLPMTIIRNHNSQWTKKIINIRYQALNSC